MLGTSMEICIVGAGPRGLAVLERICRNSAADPGHGTMRIHLVDPAAPGGAVWRSGQSTQLLMNTVASQVTVFTDDSVECDGPIAPGPSLYEWAKTVVLAGPLSSHSQRVHLEAEDITADSYPTRAFYGQYLTWVYEHLVKSAPRWVSIERQQSTAVALDDAEGMEQTVLLANGVRLTGLDAVVLAQGHLPMPLTGEQRRLLDHAQEHGLTFIPPANPADVDLSGIAPGERVILRGLGLNFFDYLALLTTGRGGSFVRSSGELVYQPCGAEPVLYTGSRRGVPYHARGENQKGVSGRHQPLFLTPPVIADLISRHRQHHDLELRRDLWPLIDREVQAVYYRTLIASRFGHEAAHAFVKDYVSAAGRSRDTERLFASFELTEQDRWNWDVIERPWGKREFTGIADYREWLLGYLRRDLVEAARGNVLGPLKSALDALRDLRNELRLLVDHSGISGRSYRDELDGWYTPLNGFLSIGPPRLRIEELVALIKAQVVHPIGPGITVGEADGGAGFWACSTQVPGQRLVARALIEARLPAVDIRSTLDPLISHLRVTGQCRAYLIPSPEGDDHSSGGLAVSRTPYRLIDALGREHPRRFAYGVPTESVHWVTAAGVRPGVNSVILSDADAIARAVLRAAAPAFAGSASTHAPPPPLPGA